MRWSSASVKSLMGFAENQSNPMGSLSVRSPAVFGGWVLHYSDLSIKNSLALLSYLIT
ncbi:hypothetical protein [Campylobacter fetus]|uniref:hypothetical protein n=1 Tax=Campylobacter fetus TaxID=196 RepID=UPI00138FB546|nr:hypothetical protein [Campylobacter fetus]